MKKISFLIFVLSVCTLIAKAQITDDFESYTPFTVDPVGTWTYYDGDGVQAWGWNDVTVPNLPYTGSCIIMNPTQTSPVATDSYAAHSGNQYLAIFNANPNYMTTTGTTNDWVISPQMPSIDGGTLTFWARILTTNYSPETMRILYSSTNNSPSSFTQIQEVNVSTTTWTQYSYSIPAGATYVAINCVSDDKFALFIDDINISFTTSEPTIFVSPSAIDFGTVDITTPEIRTVSVNGYGLSANITANTSGLFSLSADGTNFSNNITLPSTGGTLYVRYAPTAVATNTGSVTLFSGANIATISLTGSGFDCGTPRQLPYYTTFAANDPELDCWQSIDVNGDADSDHHGEFFFNGNYSSDNDGIAQYFYNASNAANDWMISPLIALGYNSRASFDYQVRSSDYPETFSIYIIPEGATYTNAVQVLASQTVTSTDWVTQNVNLSAYDNQNVRFAFHVTSSADMWFIAFDNLLVEGDIPPTLTSDVNGIIFDRTLVGNMKEDTVVLTSTHLNEPINVVTTAPFSVSLDGLNFFTNLTIPANPAINVDDIVYVRFVPEAAGAYSENITATTSTLSVSIILKGDAFDCDTVTEFTFTEDFETTSNTIDCWDVDDANLDGITFTFEDGAAQYAGNGVPADDWLFSPMMELTGNQVLTFSYRNQNPSTTETFVVVATNGGITIPLSDALETSTNTYESIMIDLRSLNGTYRLAIHCISGGASVLYIDNFVVREADEQELIANPASMEFTTGIIGQPTEAQTAWVSGMFLMEDIAISVTAPFEISIDNDTYSNEATIAVEDFALNEILYVRYNPTEEGTHSGMVILTSGNLSDTIILNGTATSGIISVTPSSMTFSGMVGQVTEAQTAQVIGTNLSQDITVSTAAPFEISTDDETYSTETTITVTGSEVTATLYVRYSPDASGTHSGVVNLVSGTATATITLNGTAGGVGIEENTNRAIVIYPNPASTLLNVEAEGYDNLQILNIVGQVVYASEITGRTEVNVSGLSNGVYFVRLTNDNGTATQKFIKK